MEVLVFIVGLLAAPPSAAAQDDKGLIVASCYEESMIASPCAIYRIRLSDGTFAKIGEVAPEGGIRMVKLCPEKRKLAVWLYDKRSPESKPERSGKVVVVDTDRPAERVEFAIPYEPVLGGFFYTPRAGGLAVITEGALAKGHPAMLSVCETGESKAAEYTAVAWDETLLYGHYRWCSSDALGMRIDPDTGDLAAAFGYSVFPTKLRLDKAALSHFNAVTNRGSLCYKVASLPDNAGLGVNSPEHAVLVTHVKKEGAQEAEPLYAVCDKKSNTWTWFSISSPEGKKAWSGSLERFGDRLVTQELMGEVRHLEQGDYVPESRFLFYDFAGKAHGAVWNAAPNTELLAIEAESLFFRRDDGIYLSPFHDGKVGPERLLCKDQAFKNVHWAVSY